jgi:glutamyl/glutaminyl-tRNA synthetase
VNKAGSVVNVDRLRWINSRHVRGLFSEENVTDEHKLAVVNDVLPMIASTLEEAGLSSAPAEVVGKFGLNYVWRAMDLMKVRAVQMQVLRHIGRSLRMICFVQERVSALPEFGPLCIPFFTDPDLSSSVAQDMEAKYIDENTPELVADVCSNLRNLSDEDFTPVGSLCLPNQLVDAWLNDALILQDHITKSIKAVAKSRKLGLKKYVGTKRGCCPAGGLAYSRLCFERRVLMPIRYYLTGMDVGAGLGDTIELLGRDTVLRRLE